MESGSAISEWIAELGIWPLLVMILPTVLVFRKYGAAALRKRMASLSHAIAVFLFSTVAALIASTGSSDLFLLVAIAAIAVASYFLRKRMFPYRLTCPECGKRHELLTAEFKNIYIMDDNLCDECRKRLQPAEESDD
jgi:8-oxo-dGTP diphosphatase